MKKNYIVPSMDVAAMKPMTIICASITQGPPVNPTDPPEYGD